MQEAAKFRGGKCLSKEFIDQYSPLAWMCKRGHMDIPAKQTPTFRFKLTPHFRLRFLLGDDCLDARLS